MPVLNEVKTGDKLVRYQKVVPTTADDIATKDIDIVRIRLSNTTAAAITVTLQDKQTTPLEHYKDVSVSAKTVTHEAFGSFPLRFESGADIQASATGLVADIVGWITS